MAPASLIAVVIDVRLLRSHRSSKIIWVSLGVALALLVYGASIFSFGN